MSKVRTSIELQDLLDREFAWRIKEISDLRSAVRAAAAGSERTLIRAGIAMLYAHWEGFVKTASELYLAFLTAQGVPYGKLQRCYIAFGMKGRISQMAQAKKPQAAREVVDFLLDSLGQPARIAARGAIDTESNLRSHVFSAIAGWLGIDASIYETKYTFIDNSLCDRRNSIAHGEFLDVGLKEYVELSDTVIGLIRGFKTDLENMVTLKSYLV